VTVDEVLINGRRYRVPERIVVLDFWNKVSTKANAEKEGDGEAATSGMSSPLTSLSSLDDSDERIPMPSESRSAHNESHDDEDLRAAQMLCNFQLSIRDHSSHTSRSMSDRAVQTDSEMSFPSTSTGRPARTSTLKRAAHNKATVTNGHSRTPMNPADAGPSTSTAKRKRNVNGAGQPPPTPSTRELRPRSSRQVESMISVSSKESSTLDDPFISLPSKSAVRVKMEEHENGIGIFGGSPVASSSKTTSRGRPIRRPSQKGAPEREEPPKRGKKRKEREEDLESEDEDEELREAVEQVKKSRTEKEKVSKGKEKEKPKEKEKKNPSPTRPAKALPAASTSTSGAPPPAPAPVTPSLKIRLPRLSDIAMHTSPPAAKPKSLVDNGARG